MAAPGGPAEALISMDLSDLKKRLSSGKLFHAYIVTGGGPETREAAGKLIAGAAVCSGSGAPPCGVCRDCVKVRKGVHPDVELISREEGAREHTVDAMRAVRSRAAVMPNEAARSVYVIRDADAMNPQAQNAMLKVFEEPPAHAVFVLLAGNPQRLLETVRSRCETVNLAPSEASGDPELAEKAGLLVKAAASGDDMALVRAALEAEKLSRTELPDYLDAARRAAANSLGRPGGMTAQRLEIFSHILDRADKMAAVNVSAGHIAGLLLAGLCQKSGAGQGR